MPPLAGWTLWITGFVGKVPVLDQLMRLLVNDFFILLAICLIMLGLWIGHPDRSKREPLQRTVINAAVAIGIAALIVKIMNVTIPDLWPRPFQVNDSVIRESAIRATERIFYFPHDPSFPCKPTAVAFAAATGIWLGNRKAGVVLYVLATLWGIARFYAGTHFFVDVIGGAAIGILTGLFISKVFMPRVEPFPTWALKLARLLYIA
jgi:membrane-associated phospholipid phosphatase